MIRPLFFFSTERNRPDSPECIEGSGAHQVEGLFPYKKLTENNRIKNEIETIPVDPIKKNWCAQNAFTVQTFCRFAGFHIRIIL